MSKILPVSSPLSAISNINTFHWAIVGGEYPKLEEIMRHVQAWYAVPDGLGYRFAPSKFIGYESMHPRLYLQETGKKGSLDGRVTEKVLSGWAEPVDVAHPKYAEIKGALNRFCAAHKQVPNVKARISILSEETEQDEIDEAQQVQALCVLINALSESGKLNLKKRLWP